MTTTDLKPGDIVQHPEHGYGVVLKNFPGVPTIYFAGKHGYENTTRGFTGWERVENCTTDERRILDGLCGRYHVFLAEKLDADEQGDARGGDRETERASGWFTCPWCQESVAAIHLASRDANGCVVPLSLSTSHRCPPVQPDEPTEFGARVSVTLPDGTREKWCRLGKHHPAPWLGETYEVPGEAWSLLCGRGTVTIGWDE